MGGADDEKNKFPTRKSASGKMSQDKYWTLEIRRREFCPGPLETGVFGKQKKKIVNFFFAFFSLADINTKRVLPEIFQRCWRLGVGVFELLLF